MPHSSPRRAAEFLAELPACLPPGATRLPDGMTLGNVQRGDLIAVSRRWLPILACTDVNGFVTVRLDSEIEAITGVDNTPVHLARKAGADATAMAPRQ